MVDSAHQVTQLSPDNDPMAYEQPLTERMRTFLRVEFLHQQALFHAKDPTDFAARAAVDRLLEILTIVGRGDVRADVLKELDRHGAMLEHYRRTPGIDSARLQSLIGDVERLRAQLRQLGPSFVNPLKEHDFLNTIRNRSAIPGGTCTFDLPDYAYWLHLPHEERSKHLHDWLAHLAPLVEAVAEVLWLTREANEPVERTAPAGLYHHTLDRNEQVSLVRVLLPVETGLFPEISAGQHRFTVRFVEWLGVDSRPRQTSNDVKFLLALS